jgi:hypothetical protein
MLQFSSVPTGWGDAGGLAECALELALLPLSGSRDSGDRSPGIGGSQLVV